MKECISCRAGLEDTARFCTVCGAEQIQQEVFCTNCGKKILHSQAFCPHCGISRTRTAPMITGADDSILKNLSDRIAINGVIWILIAVSQLLYVFLDDGSFWIFLMGIVNLFSGIGMLNKNLLDHREGIVAEYKIEIDILWEYAWNGIIAVVALGCGDYLWAMLAVLAIVTDFFLVKLYVARHKSEFLLLEENREGN